MTVAQSVFPSPPRCDMSSAFQNCCFCPQWCEAMLARRAEVLHWSKRHNEGFTFQSTCLCPPAVTVCLFKNPPLPAKPARQGLLPVEGSKSGRSPCSWRGERLCPPWSREMEHSRHQAQAPGSRYPQGPRPPTTGVSFLPKEERSLK